MSGMTIKVYRLSPETGESRRISVRSFVCRALDSVVPDPTRVWPRCRCARCRDRERDTRSGSPSAGRWR